MSQPAPVLFVGYNQTLAAKLARVFDYGRPFPLFDHKPIARNVYRLILVCTDTNAWEFAVEQLARRGENVVVCRLNPGPLDQEILSLGAKLVINHDDNNDKIRAALKQAGLVS